MGVVREFVGFERPAVEEAARRLIGMGRRGPFLDLSDVVVVVPGRRAGRLLLARTLTLAQAEGVRLSPPEIVTPGVLADVVYGGTGGAGGIARRLAWRTVLEGASDEERGALAAGLAEGDWRGIRLGAEMLARAHEELCGAGLTFRDVLEVVRRRAPLDEARWRVAAELQDRYAGVLESWGTRDGGLSRIAASERGRAQRGRVVLVGVPELPGIARRALRDVEEVTALVVAEERDADAFDGLGCVVVRAWAEREVGLSGDQVEFADGPLEEAERALIAASEAAHAEGVAGVTVVAGGDSWETIEAVAEEAGTRVHVAAGEPAERTAPARLLGQVAELLETRGFSAGAGLARHADFEAALGFGSGEAARWLDRSRRRAVPTSWRSAAGPARRVVRRVCEMLGSLWEKGERPVGAWGEAIVGLLDRVYGDWDAGQGYGRRVADACALIVRSAEELGGLPDGVRTTAAEAVRLVLGSLKGESLAHEPREGALEVVGWLEALLDPASAVVVTRCNEGTIPAGSGGDALLPLSLREALGIRRDATVAARDAYLLWSLVRGRRRVRVLACRSDGAGNPLWPSRLIVRGGDAAQRVLRFVRGGEGAVRLVRGPVGRDNLFRPPRASAEGLTVESMRVTAFKTYLASPRRFYYEHVLRLEEVPAEPAELGPLEFGSLVHRALEAFARSDARESDDPARINEAVQDALADLVRRQMGRRPSVVARLQVEMARRRLERFARWQAARRREGWRIWREPEWTPGGPASLDVDGVPMGLRGKIDRIDIHEDGRVAILDYKTGSKAKPPDEQHRRAGRWVDLQLPLYRHLAAELYLPDRVVLGYVVLSAQERADLLCPAPWGAEDLAEADETAREVVRRIRRGEFDEVGDLRDDGGSISALLGLGVLPEGEGG